MSLWVVVGGQYGSEGKGKIAAFITQQEKIDICIRCGGPNSGHSLVQEDGSTLLLRQLPTGVIRPETRLLVPAGALLDPIVLKEEIDSFVLDETRVGVDRKAMIIEERDREAERSLRLRERLSSTLCGVGSAVSRRVLRGTDVKLAKDTVDEHPWLEKLLTDVSAETNAALDADKRVVVEGTQGFGLSLYHSPHYPKATSRDTTASGFLSEVGISPLRVTEVVLVLRTFPIRVAGDQAGPLKDEITWQQLQEESGSPEPLHEITSVTRKTRRIGRFDWELAEAAVRVNRPTVIAINGLDYLNFHNRSRGSFRDLGTEAQEFVQAVETRLCGQVGYFGTGPKLGELFTNVEAHASRMMLACSSR